MLSNCRSFAAIKLQNQNQIFRQQILVNNANNAAAALYQQQMNQAYYVQM